MSDETKPRARRKTVDAATTALPDGHVMARILPRGHGRVHTGREQLKPFKVTEEDAEFKGLRGEELLKAMDKAVCEASVRTGRTFSRGEEIPLPRDIADVLEDRGYVEIADREQPPPRGEVEKSRNAIFRAGADARGEETSTRNRFAISTSLQGGGGSDA